MRELTNKNYQEILKNLKDKIRTARQHVSIKINYELLKIYWEIGNTILEQQKLEGWGTKVIGRLAKDLKMEFPDMMGLSERNLVYMQTFAASYPYFPFTQAPLAESGGSTKKTITQASLAELQHHETHEVSIVEAPLAQLSWYHHTTLLDKVKDKDIRHFYILETIKNGWSRNIMVHQIEGALHERVGKISSNFKNTIAPEQSELVQQLFKDPYKFDFIYLGKEARERDLEDALTNQLTKFLIELGQFFSFMGRQYKLMLGEKEYFFDLLFYHTRLKRYIIIDLKIDEFKPEYKGKMEFYLNLADDHLKQHDDGKSIGLILCKTKDGLVAEYALRDSSRPIGIAEYKINELLPENIRGELPSIEELEAEIDKGYEELKSPSQKRFDALKEKLSTIKGNEIKQTATTEILFEIIDKSLVPLYESILKRMEHFKDWFVSSHWLWYAKNKTINNISELPEHWKNEDFLRNNFDFIFTYHLDGFIKGGTEGFNTGFQLNYRIDTYWYGFTLVNYNNQQPFLKKLYHEQLTKNDIDEIVEAVYEAVLDQIERNIERIKI